MVRSLLLSGGMSRRLASAATLLAATALYGCPATVEILESDAEPRPLELAEGYDVRRFTLDIDTPEDAFPGEDGFAETVKIVAVLKTDLRTSGEAEVELLVADDSDRDGDVRNGQSRRVTVFGSETELVIERFLSKCDERPCPRRIDIDFLKSGDAAVTGTWRIEHEIDWYGEGKEPPAHAVSTLQLTEY